MSHDSLEMTHSDRCSCPYCQTASMHSCGERQSCEPVVRRGDSQEDHLKIDDMRQNENHSEYRTYSEAKPVVASPAKMFRIALLSSLSVFVSFVMIGTLVAYGKDGLNSGEVAAFIKQIADHNFRNSVLSVQAIVASVDVALVVISWKKFGRPEDGEPIQLRIWLSRVLEDARRETATAFIMIILAMVTGGLFSRIGLAFSVR